MGAGIQADRYARKGPLVAEAPTVLHSQSKLLESINVSGRKSPLAAVSMWNSLGANLLCGIRKSVDSRGEMRVVHPEPSRIQFINT